MPAKRKLTVKVRRQDVAYPVVVCPKSSFASLREVFEELRLFEIKGDMGRVRRRACVLLDGGFAQARPDVALALKRFFPEKSNLHLLIPGTESSKSLSRAEKILGEMIRFGLTRNDFCLAVGGGVVGDLGGFVASLYHRGIDVVHLPTTLLAMVDSSIGGKTAVNHSEGKNLIGAFHQPAAVIAVLDFLESLPDLDFKSGLGEVFKYGAGFSAALFKYLEGHANAILARDPKALAHILLESVAIKSAVVLNDEKETGVAQMKVKGSRLRDRRLLNLGHTTGHGLEKAYALPHGLAVAMGVTLAAKLSSRLGLCTLRCYDQVMTLSTQLGLKTHADIPWKLAEILPYLKRDKKVVGERVQFVCLSKVGHSFVRPTAFKELELLER